MEINPRDNLKTSKFIIARVHQHGRNLIIIIIINTALSFHYDNIKKWSSIIILTVQSAKEGLLTTQLYVFQSQT